MNLLGTDERSPHLRPAVAGLSTADRAQKIVPPPIPATVLTTAPLMATPMTGGTTTGRDGRSTHNGPD